MEPTIKKSTRYDIETGDELITVEAADEGGGEFIVITSSDSGELRLNPEEWPAVYSAINSVVEEITAREQKPQEPQRIEIDAYSYRIVGGPVDGKEPGYYVRTKPRDGGPFRNLDEAYEFLTSVSNGTIILDEPVAPSAEEKSAANRYTVESVYLDLVHSDQLFVMDNSGPEPKPVSGPYKIFKRARKVADAMNESNGAREYFTEKSEEQRVQSGRIYSVEERASGYYVVDGFGYVQGPFDDSSKARQVAKALTMLPAKTVMYYTL